MKMVSLKIIRRVLCLILLLALLPMAGKLEHLKTQRIRLSEEIQATERTTHQYNQKADSIRQQLEGSQRNLEQKIVNLADPIAWHIERLRNQVGLSNDLEMECLGMKPIIGTVNSRAARSMMEGTLACLVPYAIRIDLREVTLAKLYYVLEQLEAETSYALIQYLKIDSEGSEKIFSATAIVYTPAFRYPKDHRDIQLFFDQATQEKHP